MRILLLFIILAAFQKVSAQETAGGFKAGMNLANIKGDFGKDLETVPKMGFHIGGFIEFRSKGIFSFQHELIYGQKGYKFLLPSGKKIIHNLSYLDMPFLGKLTFKDGTNIHFGPQLSMLLASKVRVEGFPDNRSTHGINKYDFSLAAGIGVQIVKGLGIGGRYNFGLSRVMESLSDATAPSRVLQVFLVWDFNPVTVL
jgi:hypothetical protein